MTSAVDRSDTIVVVPMLNEATSVGQVISDLHRSFPRVVCIDDGSTDSCHQVAVAAGATVLRHPVNLGAGAAIQTGFTYALADPTVQYVVTFDADGQHNRADAERMCELARTSGVDVVLGSRFLGETRTDMPRTRRLLLKGGTWFTRATTRLELTDTHNGLRVLNRRALGVMDLTLDGMAHASQLLNQVAQHRLSYVEASVTIAYTEYSMSRGQSNANAFNIAFDLALERLRGAGSA